MSEYRAEKAKKAESKQLTTFSQTKISSLDFFNNYNQMNVLYA